MTNKRRDNKGRILWNGESQERDGRYVYKYRDLFGNRKTVRSWRLTKTDPVPNGKHPKPSLRELEAEIKANLTKGIGNNDITVLELVDRYESTLTGLRETTLSGHKTVRKLLERESFGHQRISRIKISDAKLFLIKLQKQDGKGYSSIHTIRGVLRQAFRMAVEDDMLPKNPFDFELVNVIVNDSVRRDAISPKDERRFLDFIANDKHFRKYYDAIFILFNTGMRISEFCGLTIKDIDFKQHKINIDRQLQRTSQMKYIIQPPKTESGVRQLPMEKEVEEAFRRIIQTRKSPKVEPMIDGYTGFLFLDKNNMPMVALHWEKYFEHIVEKYNKTYKLQMPKVTPHVCRHTYCSKKAKSGMNPKTLQYLMGHSDISVTLNVYTHIGFEDAQKEVGRLESVQII